MSDADTIREAARVMRERAEGVANPGPWRAAEQTHGTWHGLQSDYFALGNIFDAGDAAHVASWPPEVALVVASWLEACALVLDISPHVVKAHARKVARTYLRQQP